MPAKAISDLLRSSVTLNLKKFATCLSLHWYWNHYIVFYITKYCWNVSALFSKLDHTTLQKLSKCEVKAWLCWNLIILLPLRFYVKSNFGEFKRSKLSFLPILETLNFDFLVNLALGSCSNSLKSKFRTFKIAKNDIFGPFEFAKIVFHVKSE